MQETNINAGQKLPYGYQYTQNDHGVTIVEVCPAEAANIEGIFRLLGAGESIGGIARLFDQEQILDQGKPFSLKRIEKIARNKLYIGGAYGGSTLPGIVSLQLFENANKHLKKKERPESYDYLLKGLVLCGECNERMLAARGNTSWYRYPNAQCPVHSIQAQELDWRVRLQTDELLCSSKRRIEVSTALYQRLLDECRKGLRELNKQLRFRRNDENTCCQMRRLDGTSLGTLIKQLLKIEVQEKTLEKAIAEAVLEERRLERALNMLKQLTIIAYSTHLLTNDERSEITTSVIEKIVVHSDKAVINFAFPAHYADAYAATKKLTLSIGDTTGSIIAQIKEKYELHEAVALTRKFWNHIVLDLMKWHRFGREMKLWSIAFSNNDSLLLAA